MDDEQENWCVERSGLALQVELTHQDFLEGGDARGELSIGGSDGWLLLLLLLRLGGHRSRACAVAMRSLTLHEQPSDQALLGTSVSGLLQAEPRKEQAPPLLAQLRHRFARGVHHHHDGGHVVRTDLALRTALQGELHERARRMVEKVGRHTKVGEDARLCFAFAKADQFHRGLGLRRQRFLLVSPRFLDVIRFYSQLTLITFHRPSDPMITQRCS